MPPTPTPSLAISLNSPPSFVVLHESLDWNLLIVVLMSMSSSLFATFEPQPLSKFHLSKHSLASVYSMFLDTFYIL
jgi:hypothetical protein